MAVEQGSTITPARIPVESDSTESGQSRNENVALARQLVSRGAYISAADLLENEYANKNHSLAVINLLLTCYMELKAYNKAEVLLKRQIRDLPDVFMYYTKLLELYLMTGEDAEIGPMLDTINAHFPIHEDYLKVQLRLLIEFGRTDQALSIIENARRELKKDKLFSLEAASIFEIQRDYGRAVREYCRLSDGDSLTVLTAERGLSALIRYPGAAPDVISALTDILAGAPNSVFANKMLLEAYSHNQQYADAFAICVALDSLTDAKGTEVFNYIRRCRERKLHQQVIDASEYIESQDFDKGLISQYKFFYAEALVGTGRYQEALTNFNEIEKNYTHLRDKAEALLGIANVFRYFLHELDSARYYYTEITSRFKQGVPYIRSILELANLHVAEGDLAQARQSYETLAAMQLNQDILEYVSYMLAMIHFYEKDFASAELGFRKLIEDYPRGYYVNDALMHSLIIGENALGAASALEDFADAEYFEERLMPDSVENRLMRIREMDYSAVFGLASYRLAEFYVQKGDTSSALTLIAEMEDKYTEDYYFPYCLKLKGDIYAADEKMRNDAVTVYTELLERYGMYPFIGEVRDSLQRLDGYHPPGQS
ncbi:MAG: hypothetical protein JW763_07445 [candidate division Zixibacteria bacterium]|nr:hypothetical protein [candidate division Zixibacteria bacterium]